MSLADAVVYAKTAKGVDEVESRANGLSLIERRVLIFIDGNRTVADLCALPRVLDLEAVLEYLMAAGFIRRLLPDNEPIKADPVPPEWPEIVTRRSDALSTVSSGAVVSSPFRELPATFDPKTFEMAKHFMINTLNHFKGFYGATSLVRELDACQTHEELRSKYDAWLKQMESVRVWKKRGKKLTEQLLDVL